MPLIAQPLEWVKKKGTCGPSPLNRRLHLSFGMPTLQIQEWVKKIIVTLRGKNLHWFGQPYSSWQSAALCRALAIFARRTPTSTTTEDRRNMFRIKLSRRSRKLPQERPNRENQAHSHNSSRPPSLRPWTKGALALREMLCRLLAIDWDRHQQLPVRIWSLLTMTKQVMMKKIKSNSLTILESWRARPTLAWTSISKSDEHSLPCNQLAWAWPEIVHLLQMHYSLLLPQQVEKPREKPQWWAMEPVIWVLMKTLLLSRSKEEWCQSQLQRAIFVDLASLEQASRAPCLAATLR